MKPMPLWKRWPNRARLAIMRLKYRLARLLHRWGVLPERARASTDTMGDWKKLQAMGDDAKPRLVRPPDGPYADLVRRVRLYAQNGAKALGPLLDRPLESHVIGDDAMSPNVIDWDAVAIAWRGCFTATQGDWDATAILLATASDPTCQEVYRDTLRAIHAAYNAPWTVKDGEVYEVVTEKERGDVQ